MGFERKVRKAVPDPTITNACNDCRVPFTAHGLRRNFRCRTEKSWFAAHACGHQFRRLKDLCREITGCLWPEMSDQGEVSVPGIGPIISSAMVAAIGSGEVFTKGRDFAAILGRISKRGNRYLRVLFVQAAWVRSPPHERYGWCGNAKQNAR